MASIIIELMTSALPKPWTVEDFLAWEAQQDERYEFIDGVVFMMVGASNAHTVIKGNTFAALRSRLRGGACDVLVDGPKVVMIGEATLPDLVVTCKPVDLADDRVDEPAAIVEILSPWTANRDRGPKWTAYQNIPSLRHYVLIAQDRRRVEVYTRAAKGWLFAVVEPPEGAVALTEIGAELSLDEIYERSGV